MNNEQDLFYKYTFKFHDGITKEFLIRLDKDNLEIIRDSKQEFPEWTMMQNFRCSHCPLNEKTYEYCPLAISLTKVIDEFRNCSSFENVDVFIQTNNRNYQKNTSLQSGVSSLLGIMMVSSGCPIMAKLKPLLHFHLPFATLEETEIRVFSTYLLAQCIKWKKREKPDWEMNGLFLIYEDIRTLNHNVSKKIADLESKDTSINSIVILNNFADFVTFTLDERTIDELEIYLKEFF